MRRRNPQWEQRKRARRAFSGVLHAAPINEREKKLYRAKIVSKTPGADRPPCGSPQHSDDEAQSSLDESGFDESGDETCPQVEWLRWTRIMAEVSLFYTNLAGLKWLHSPAYSEILPSNGCIPPHTLKHPQIMGAFPHIL